MHVICKALGCAMQIGSGSGDFFPVLLLLSVNKSGKKPTLVTS